MPTLTDDKVRKIMSILQNDEEALRTVVRKAGNDDQPTTLSYVYGEVIRAGVPIEFTVEANGKSARLHLPEGQTDGETVSESTIRNYNHAMAVLGMQSRLPEDLRFADLCRAHMLLHKHAPAATAAPMPKEAPVSTSTKSKPKTHLWKGKPCTEAQFNARVIQVGGWDNVPVDSGEVGISDDDRHPIDPLDNCLQHDEEVLVEVIDDIVVPIEVVKRASVIIDQQPDPKVKANAVDVERVHELLALVSS